MFLNVVAQSETSYIINYMRMDYAGESCYMRDEQSF